MADELPRDFGLGIKKAFDRVEFRWEWRPEYAIILGVAVGVAVLWSGVIDSIFLRYRRHIRAQRRERKKRDYLIRIFLDAPLDNEGQTVILRRLVRYYQLTPGSGGVTGSPEDMLKFAQTLVRHIRKLDYDKRGRLVIPSFESQLEKSAQDEMSGRKMPVETPAAWSGSVMRNVRESAEPMGKAARVALSMIRFNKPMG